MQVMDPITLLIYRIFTVTFLILGTVTNAISAIIYSKKKMRKTSYSFYLFSLAICDLCVTITGNSRLAVIVFTTSNSPTVENETLFDGFDLRESSIVACRMHKFFTYFFLELSSIILCFLNIDRFFGCVLVLKASKFCKASVAKRLVLSAICLLFIFNSHFLILNGNFDYIDISNDTFNSSTSFKCVIDERNVYYQQFWTVFFYLDSAIYGVIPFMIMITCNFMIIGKIVKSRIRSKKVIVTRSRKSSSSKIIKNANSMLATEKRLSLILIGISLSFLLFTTPVFIIETFSNFQSDSFVWEIFTAVSYLLMYLNHVINFFFYCLLGPKFRREVRNLFPFLRIDATKIYPLKMRKSDLPVNGSSVALNPKLKMSGLEMSVTTRHPSSLKKIAFDVIYVPSLLEDKELQLIRSE